MPTGRSASWRNVWCPAMVTTPPMGTIANARNAGSSDRYGARKKILPVGGVGHRLFLEEQLDAVGERLEQSERAGAVGTDAVLHARDHLAQEPDVQEHRQQHEHEHRDRLADHDQHDREVDAVREERIGDGDDGHDASLIGWSRPGAR